MSGIRGPMSDTINFTLTLQPYAFETSARIEFNPTQTSIYSLAVHLMFVDTSCTWLWVFSECTYLPI